MFRQQHHDWLRGFHRSLFRYACGLCAHTASAEDLYHEALVRAMSAKSVPSEPTAFRIWMFQVMRNLWIDDLRARARAKDYASSEQIDAGTDGPASECEDAVVNRLAVRQAFMQLSKDHREVLALVDIAGFSYVETGMLLSIPEGTVMSRVSRAREALARRLSSDQVIAFPGRQGAGR